MPENPDQEDEDPLLSRVDELKRMLDALEARGAGDAELLDLRSKVSRLTLAVIVSELAKEDAAYVDSMTGLDRAIDAIGRAGDQSGAIATAVRVAAKSVELVEKALAVL
jgi:hypothetical protein